MVVGVTVNNQVYLLARHTGKAMEREEWWQLTQNDFLNTAVTLS